MTRTDTCVQRITLVVMLNVLLLMGWFLVAEKLVHGFLFILFFPVVQLFWFWDDIQKWKNFTLHFEKVTMGDIIPLGMWALIFPQFPIESVIFSVLQLLYLYRRQWEIPYEYT